MLAHEAAHQRDLLLAAQLARQGDLHLARQLRIHALLRPLHEVPEGLTVEHPGRCPGGCEDLGMDDVGLVELEPPALRIVVQAFS